MKYIFRAMAIMSFGVFLSAVSAFALPSQVENVQVHQLNNNSVRVSWGEAESAEDIIIGYRIYFGTTSVQEEGETYDDEVVVYGGIETTINSLVPGTAYYFAVTALDSEENASENYSAEVEFLLTEGDTPTEPEPTCTDEIKNGTETDVDCGGTCKACEIPEPVKQVECAELPEKLTNCEVYECIFTHPITEKKLTRRITGIKDGTCRYTETISASKRMECRFPDEQQVLMGQYYLDVMSGVSTANLLGQALEDKQCVILEGENSVFPEKGPEVLIEKEVVQEETLEEEKFGPEKPEEFKSVAPDAVSPLEALNLSADMAQIHSDGIATLSWEKSLDLDNDVADQVLYIREGLGQWDEGYSIGKGLELLELDVEAGKNYEYKIMTIDAAGNQAESRVYSFSTKLTQSGPAGVYGILFAILLLGIFGLFSARRRA